MKMEKKIFKTLATKKFEKNFSKVILTLKAQKQTIFTL